MAAPRTLLEMAQAAADELGLPTPVTIFGVPDATEVQMRALFNRDIANLYQERDWTVLQRELVINLTAPLITTGDVLTGSTTISNIPDTSLIEAGSYIVQGNGAPQSQRVVAVLSPTSVQTEMQAIATEVGAQLTFVRDTFSLPIDFDRYISNTWWDRTQHWQLIGPQSPQLDQWERSGIVATGPRRKWRQIGVKPTVYRIWPPPTINDTPAALVFEYVTDGCVQHENGTFGKRFTADTDITLLDEDAVIMGLKWRMWQAKGFDYAALQGEYVDYVDRYKARDGGMPDLSLTRRRLPILISSASVQDGYFPGPT